MINTEEAPTGRSPGSLAWAGMANTYFWIDPAKGVGGVYLTQLFPLADRKAVPNGQAPEISWESGQKFWTDERVATAA